MIPLESTPELVAAIAPAATADGEPGLAAEKNKENRPVASDRAADPIAEAPDAMWYVRPPSGGQFGPATGDILRQWIGEGRVTQDSLIWRQGWPKWVSAGSVLSGLQQNSAKAVPDSQPEAPVPKIVTTASAGQRFRTPRKKYSSKSVVILLGLACLVLFVVLVFVINRNS